MAEIRIYVCDVCGACSKKKPPNYVTYWEGYKDGERHIQHICDDCWKELKSTFHKLQNSRKEEVAFVGNNKLIRNGSLTSEEGEE